DAAMAALAGALRRQGRRPYVIPLGIDHAPLGALGYVVAGQELADQAAAAGLRLGAVVTPSGSASTHSGLVVGLRAAGLGVPVIGVCVRRDAAAQQPRVARRVAEVCALIGRPGVAGAA